MSDDLIVVRRDDLERIIRDSIGQHIFIENEVAKEIDELTAAVPNEPVAVTKGLFVHSMDQFQREQRAALNTNHRAQQMWDYLTEDLA